MGSALGIETLVGVDAWRNLREGDAAFWPMRNKINAGRDRFHPLPKVQCRLPKLTTDSTIMTLGSCFASNLLKYLAFYSVDSLNSAYLQTCTPNDIQWTNIYTPTVFLQFIEMAKEIQTQGTLSEASQKVGLVAEGDLYTDLMFTIERKEEALSLSDTIARRESFIRGFISNIFKADCIVLTLGLVESWFDTQYQSYINVTPSEDIVQANPGRFEFRVLEYSQVLDALRSLIDIVHTLHPKTPSFIFTVSPVPLRATFRDQDVITSNMYSKSLLRSAIEPLLHEYSNVYYYPSYEILMHTSQLDLWTNDLRHIHPRYITYVIQTFADYALDTSTYPAVELHGVLLTYMTEMLSETQDAPDNDIREIGVGFYNLFPAMLNEDQIAKLQTLYTQYQEYTDVKAVALAKLILFMHQKDAKNATQALLDLIANHTFVSSYEVAILAGYGLQLKQSDAVISILERFRLERHEYWQMYQHYFLAHCQKLEFNVALQYANQCFNNVEMAQWLLVDNRAPLFITQVLKVAKRQGDGVTQHRYSELQRLRKLL